VPEALDALPPPAAADPETAVRDAFRAALAGFRRDDGPVLVMGHNDADGLSATAIFLRALRKDPSRINCFSLEFRNGLGGQQ
jgi:hypothetical protein